MVRNRIRLFDDYNTVKITIMQGVEGGVRAVLHLMSIRTLLWGSWRDTRRGCVTARTPYFLLCAVSPKIQL